MYFLQSAWCPLNSSYHSFIQNSLLLLIVRYIMYQVPYIMALLWSCREDMGVLSPEGTGEEAQQRPVRTVECTFQWRNQIMLFVKWTMVYVILLNASYH